MFVFVVYGLWQSGIYGIKSSGYGIRLTVRVFKEVCTIYWYRSVLREGCKGD